MPREAKVILDRSSFDSALQAYRQRIAVPDDDRKKDDDAYDLIELIIDGEPVQALIELVTFDDQAGATDVLLHIQDGGFDTPDKYVIVHRTTSAGTGMWAVEPMYHLAFADNTAIAVHYLAFKPQPQGDQGVIPL